MNREPVVVSPVQAAATVRRQGWVSACRNCGDPVRWNRGGAYHTITGTVSCRPVVDADGGWAER